MTAAFAEGRAIVDATEDRLAQAVVRLALSVALSAAVERGMGLAEAGPGNRVTPERAAIEAQDRLTTLGVGLPGWDLVFRMVAGQTSAPDPVAVVT